MRTRTALAGFLLIGLAALAFVSRGAQSQAAGDPAVAAASSLDLGPPFDRQAQSAYEQQLSLAEQQRLVRLQSRFAPADITCPVPTDEPRQPFYVKFNRDLTREVAGSLQAAGASFVGYCYPHTHIVRGRDLASLDAIRALLLGHPMVDGTLLQRPEDRMDAATYERVGDLTGEYRVLFWRDTNSDDAAALLAQAGAALIEGKAPNLTLALPDAGVKLMLASVWVEQIIPRCTRETTNTTSTAMSNANQATVGVSPYLLDGNGQVAGVWDAGVARTTHEQYTGLGGVIVPAGWTGTSRIINVNSTTMHYHAAHVTGTIIGNGTNNATAHGYAPKAVALVHLWNNVDSGRRDARHFFTHVADNHSYTNFGGGGTNWGGYNADTQEPDVTNRDILLCQVQSAGNYATSAPVGGKPFGGSNPTCSVSTSNAHRNGYIIAAAEDNENLASFSSCGPAMDGRLVPQFCANGVGLVSSGEAANNDYNTLSGTSMSSPSVCGSVVLLSQLWRREHNDQLFTPDIGRAVLAQTCRDKYHPGPDYHYGFGIVDCKAAADLILADKAAGGARIFRGTITSGAVKDYSFDVSGTAPLHFVLNWLDIWASTTASVTMVNDLDIELVDPANTVYYPYSGVTTLTSSSHTYAFTNIGPNTRDNIELVHVDNPMAGTWTLRIKGSSIPVNPQTGVPNDATGFVVAGSHNVTLQKLFFNDAVNGATPVSIPDNNAAGITRTFTVNDARVVVGVRVLTRIHHERRGDIAITLTAPGGPTVNLKTVNNGMLDDEYDVIAVFPDTKQDDDDMSAFHLKPVQGVWSVKVSDTGAGNTGTLNYLAIEFDLRVNNAPNADAGSNVSLRENNPGQLNGTASSDPDGDPFTYLWAQTGGAVTVSPGSATAAQPAFTAPSVSQDEVVTFQLTVTDASGASDTDTVQITIQNNLAPQANAGTDVTVREAAGGQLNATGSSDPENDPITYLWTQLSGVTMALGNATAAQPTFTAPAVTQDEVLVYQLTATDNRGDFGTDTVQVTITNNLAPLADAGADVTIREAAGGQLDATGSSDPESDPITYLWTQLSGVSMALSNPTSAQPTFAAPAVTQDEVLVYQVTVTDNRGDFDTDTVQVTISNNLAPVANAGTDVTVREVAPGQLDATGTTDPESDPITYLWTQLSGVTLVLSNPAAVQPTFTTPAVTQDEILVFQLTATDNRGDSGTDTVQVTITNNLAPQANAGADFALITGDTGALDATASTDPESDPLTYAWVQTLGTATVTLSDPAVAQPTFTAPALIQSEMVTFQVTVTDDRGDFAADTVVITIELNVAPVADAGVNFALAWNASSQLDASASFDPNTGDTLTYAWVQTGGTTIVTLSNPTDPQPTFTAPGVDDTLTFLLTVTDARGLTDIDSVRVYVNEAGTPPKTSGGGGKDGGGGGCSTSDTASWWWLMLVAVLMLTLGWRLRRLQDADIG